MQLQDAQPPLPLCAQFHLGLKWVGFTGGLLAKTQECGGGAGPGGQRVWTGRAQCPPGGDSGSVSSLPQTYSGLLFPGSPSWWKSQQHLRSADPSAQGETTVQGQPAFLGHTASESLWQHPQLPTRPSPAETPKGASGSKARIAGKANANAGDATQQGAQNHTAPQGAAP